jgi:deoxyribodipyrimidine photolyase-like uncharacterized protein
MTVIPEILNKKHGDLLPEEAISWQFLLVHQQMIPASHRVPALFETPQQHSPASCLRRFAVSCEVRLMGNRPGPRALFQ